MREKFSFYKKTENPQDPSLFTPFSAAHFMSGAFFFILFSWLFPHFSVVQNFILWVLIHTAYEIKDLVVSGRSNSVLNSVGDTVSSFAGFIVMALISSGKEWNVSEVVFYGAFMYAIRRTLYEPPR